MDDVQELTYLLRHPGQFSFPEWSRPRSPPLEKVQPHLRVTGSTRNRAFLLFPLPPLLMPPSFRDGRFKARVSVAACITEVVRAKPSVLVSSPPPNSSMSSKVPGGLLFMKCLINLFKTLLTESAEAEKGMLPDVQICRGTNKMD